MHARYVASAVAAAANENAPALSLCAPVPYDAKLSLRAGERSAVARMSHQQHTRMPLKLSPPPELGRAKQFEEPAPAPPLKTAAFPE